MREILFVTEDKEDGARLRVRWLVTRRRYWLTARFRMTNLMGSLVLMLGSSSGWDACWERNRWLADLVAFKFSIWRCFM